MIKIEEKQIEAYYNLIYKSDLMNINTTKSTLFFPIGLEDVQTDDSQPVLLLEEKDRVAVTGSKRFLRTGLVIMPYTDGEGNEHVKLELAYVTTEWAVPFIIKDHYRYLRTVKLRKKEVNKLQELEAYLLRNDYILGTFNY